jgi:hypothetical protein
MYDKDYIDFDVLGIVQIRCMRCNTPVANRVHTERSFEPKIFYTDKGEEITAGRFERFFVVGLHYLANYKQGKVILNTGGEARPILCAECLGHEQDEDKLMEQVKKGWVKELEYARRPASEIQNHKVKVKDLKPAKKIKRK